MIGYQYLKNATRLMMAVIMCSFFELVIIIKYLYSIAVVLNQCHQKTAYLIYCIACSKYKYIHLLCPL